MSLLSSGSISSVPVAAVRIGAMATFCSLNRPALVERLQVLEVDEALRVHRILDEVAAVGVHRRLVDAAEAAGLVDLAREEREVLRQVRQVHAAPAPPSCRRGVHLKARPIDVQVRVLPIAHHPVAFEQAVDEAGDDLRVLLGEAAVDDEHVGDDQQVAVGGEHVRLAAAAARPPPRSSAPRSRQPARRFLPGLELAQEQVAGAEAVLGVDEVDALGVRRGVEAAERADARPASCAR